MRCILLNAKSWWKYALPECFLVFEKFVCLLATNWSTDFHENFQRGVFWPNLDHRNIKIHCHLFYIQLISLLCFAVQHTSRFVLSISMWLHELAQWLWTRDFFLLNEPSLVFNLAVFLRHIKHHNSTIALVSSSVRKNQCLMLLIMKQTKK